MRNSGNLGLRPILAPLLAAITFIGCSRPSNSDPATNLLVNPIPNPDVFEVDHPEQFPLYSVESRKTFDELSTNGVVGPDVALTVHVTSLSGGRATDVRARLGDEVQKGQSLVIVNSQDLGLAISDYQKSLADESLARKSLERAQDLYAHGALALKDLQQAQDGEQKAKVDLSTSEERIRLLGGDLDHLSPILEVRSPISGTIIEQNVTSGEAVKSLDNSPNLFTIADLSRVWVLCDVYENNLSRVSLGDPAEVRLEAFPERVFKGAVSNISRILDASTRSAKVRVELENRQGLLRPGMFAVVRLISQKSETRVVVPVSALLRLHDKDWVFRAEGATTFHRLEVHTGSPVADNQQFVLTGLSPGDRIVTNALQFMSATEQK